MEEAFEAGEIDLHSELEVYRCSVIGPKSGAAVGGASSALMDS
jgi:hypothetical protein